MPGYKRLMETGSTDPSSKRRSGNEFGAARPMRLSGRGDYFDMMLVDHGFIRSGIYANRHWVTRDVIRSSQPSPAQLRGFAARGGKAVLNLRGARDCGSYRQEVDACAELGLELVNFPIRSRGAPEREHLHGLKAIFDTISVPMMMHCKSGADRAGLAAALYLHFREGQPMDRAAAQLSLRFGHVRSAKAGILDHFLETYIKAQAAAGVAFLDWVDTAYDPVAMQNAFNSRLWWGNILVDNILRRE